MFCELLLRVPSDVYDDFSSLTVYDDAGETLQVAIDASWSQLREKRRHAVVETAGCTAVYLVVEDEAKAGGGGDREVEVRVGHVDLIVRSKDLHFVSSLR